MEKKQHYFTILVLILSACAVDSLSHGDSYIDCFKKRHVSTCSNDAIYSGFRTVDGICNNLYKKTWGATHTALRRLVASAYSDHHDKPRIYTKDHVMLPFANQISQALFQVETKSTGSKNELSTLFMTFGQFLDHDLTEVPTGTCTHTGCYKADAYKYPCFPILFNPYSSKCSRFSRSRAICTHAKYGRREQVNALSAYIDASQIYSPDPGHFEELRSNDGSGRLKISKDKLLPIENNGATCQVIGGCSLVGDERGDENIPLNTMHVLWVREHNRIADKLKSMNPSWEEKQLFETARKMVGGIWQHIVYNEYLPRLIRNKHYGGYDKSVNPSITQAFATSAFRYGHSLIPNSFSQLNNNFDEQYKPISLQESFNNRQPINQHGIEPVMFGLIGNRSRVVDTVFAFGIARKLFIRPGSNGYLDLTALNIQRARDHGVPPYVAYRRFCGLSAVHSWEDLERYLLKGAVDHLRKVYNHPNDIDLFAAGIAEKHLTIIRNGKPFELEVGPTFECILSRQFYAVRDADRFFYLNKHRGVFSYTQRQAIRKVSMASIMCSNLKGIVSIQKDAFTVASGSNPRINCDRIPQLDLTRWRVGDYGDDVFNDDDDDDSENVVGQDRREIFHDNDVYHDEDEEDEDDDLDKLFDKK